MPGEVKLMPSTARRLAEEFDDMTSDKLLERPVSRSVVEEVLGILWAILATLTTSKVIAIIAWSMAGISTAAAIYFAFASLRARSQEGSSNVR